MGFEPYLISLINIFYIFGMFLTLLKSKLHRATVTEARLHYEGSITIDPELMEAAALLPYEQVDVLDVNNGARFTTYVIEGSKGSKEICINGAAARLVQPGDHVIICAYVQLSPQQAVGHQPIVKLLDGHNNIKN